MARLEKLTGVALKEFYRSNSNRGTARWIGNATMELIYKDSDGRLGVSFI